MRRKILLELAFQLAEIYSWDSDFCGSGLGIVDRSTVRVRLRVPAGSATNARSPTDRWSDSVDEAGLNGGYTAIDPCSDPVDDPGLCDKCASIDHRSDSDDALLCDAIVSVDHTAPPPRHPASPTRLSRPRLRPPHRRALHVSLVLVQEPRARS
jgi:hypothetical protein